MIKKSICFFVVIFLTPNVIKSQEVNVLLKDYTLLEYVSSSPHYYIRHIIRAKNENLWFDFRLRSIDNYDSNYELNEYIEIDSYLASLPDLSSSLYICLYKDGKIMRFRSLRPEIYKISENKVYVFHEWKNTWSLDADFGLLPTPNKNCYEREWEMSRETGLIIFPDREELVLKRISYGKLDQKIFSFVKCIPNISPMSYKHIKGVGRVEMEDGHTDLIWRLNKIDGEVVEIW